MRRHLLLLFVALTMAFLGTLTLYYFSTTTTPSPVSNRVRLELAKTRGDLKNDGSQISSVAAGGFSVPGVLMRTYRGIVLAIESDCIRAIEPLGERCESYPSPYGYIVSLSLPANSPHHPLFDKLVQTGKLSRTTTGSNTQYENIHPEKITQDEFTSLVGINDIVEIGYEVESQKSVYYALVGKP